MSSGSGLFQRAEPHNNSPSAYIRIFFFFPDLVKYLSANDGSLSRIPKQKAGPFSRAELLFSAEKLLLFRIVTDGP